MRVGLRPARPSVTSSKMSEAIRAAPCRQHRLEGFERPRAVTGSKLEMPDALYAKLDPLYLDPGFRVMNVSIWKEPKKALEPAIWKWADGRAALEEVARIVGPEHAERRNLIMRNPAEGHVYGTLRTMISAYQLMLPGEFARSHWHSRWTASRAFMHFPQARMDWTATVARLPYRCTGSCRCRVSSSST